MISHAAAETGFRAGPVYDPEPVVDIAGAHVVMLQIVGVLPDVYGQQRRFGVSWFAEVVMHKPPFSQTSHA